MILKTLQILPYILASVNPSTFIQEQPKRASEEEFTIGAKIENTASSTTTDTDEGIYYTFIKASGTAYNTALSLAAYRYDSTAHNGTNSTTGDIIVPTDSTINLNQYTSSLLAIQVTPYKFLKDTEGEIPLNLRMYNNVYIDTDTNEGLLRMQYDVITSTESYFSNYIDISNYNTIGINQDIYADLTNAENGFIYNKKTYTKEITSTSTSSIGYIEQSIDIEIVKDEINYIYILITPYITNYTTTTYGFLPTSYTSWLANTTSNYLMYITGTMITADVTYEVIDIPELMFEVLTMPFTFISIAFNLTLFPGTPYQLNISNLFLSILGILIFMFIIKMLIKVK